jgi:N-sulfoglucosamine sulfohydrolase
MQKPNILMITCHDIGQHLGCYGVETVQTSNLDNLASKGVRFDNFYSTSAVCSPGRGSLHTGRYPQSNGLMGLIHAPWHWKLNETERHTAEILKNCGYESVLIGYNHINHDAKKLGYDKVLSKDSDPVETVKEAKNLIMKNHSDEKTFFAKIGFREVHRPFKNGTDTTEGVFVPGWLQPSQDIKDDFAAFQATIKYFDECVGEILDTLAASSIADNTLVLMTADHGIPYPGAKWTVRKAGIEVPFIAYQPNTKFSGGRVFSEIMSNVDVLPTLLDYIGEKIPDNIEGYSFNSFIDGKKTVSPRKEAFSQYTPEMKRDNTSRSVITDQYHLIRYFDAGRTVDYPVDIHPQAFSCHEQRCKTRAVRPFVQLFDISNDPYELDDIGTVPENKAIVDDLSKRLLSWMEDVKDPLLDGLVRTPYYEEAILKLKNP